VFQPAPILAAEAVVRARPTDARPAPVPAGEQLLPATAETSPSIEVALWGTDGEAGPPAVPPAEPGDVRVHDADVTTSPVAALRALGIPEPLLTAVGRMPDEPVLAVTTALRALPRPPLPPSRSGDVLAVVGEAAVAYDAACRIAVDARLDPKQVVLVAPERTGIGVHHTRHLTSAAEAARRVDRLRRGASAVILAVDAPLGARGAAWAREVIGCCEATDVWCVVDAARKLPDSADQLRRIGGAEALVVHNAAVTRDPGAVLDLGVPVAMLDGRRATRAAWTALLTDRLDDDEEDK
jgi:hypothetical protein